MTDRQDQRAGEGALAIQSARDTNIHTGVSLSQMREIQQYISQQIRDGLAIAGDTVDRRIGNFERMTLEKFASLEKERQEAFADPDFQFILRQAETSYARSGDDESGRILVDLIAERSKATTRSRLQLTLDEAVEKTPRLTSEEFAILSLAFAVGRVRVVDPLHLSQLIQKMREHVSPLLGDIPTATSAYDYLEGQACVIINRLAGNSLMDMLRDRYASLLSTGFTMKELNDHLPDGDQHKLDDLVLRCRRDRTKFRLSVGSQDELVSFAAARGVEIGAANNVWGLVQSRLVDQTQLVEECKAEFPELERLFELWDSTPLKHMVLTPVGIAIAHSNLVRLTSFSADLSIWIS